MKQKNKNPSPSRKAISETRKDFYKRLFYILLGVIPIIVWADKKGNERFVVVAALFFAGYHLIMIIGSAQFIVDDFFPPKTSYETRAKPFDRFMYYFSTIFFAASLVFLLFEIRPIANTLNGMTLFWIWGLVGIAAAAIFTIILKASKPSVFYDSKRRITVYSGIFIGAFIMMPAAASFINQHFATENISCKNYVIQRKSTSGKRNTSSWLFLRLENGKEERFDVTRDFYNEVSEGGQVKLCTRKGKLGFDFVIEFKTADNW